VSRETLASRGKNSPLLGRDLAGVVLLTVHDGRIAYRAEALGA
jgi:dihydroorotase-like cyclic amidohydrolase